MGGPKLRGRGLFIEKNAAAIDRFRRAYGALSDDDGATHVELESDLTVGAIPDSTETLKGSPKVSQEDNMKPSDC